MPVSVYTGMSKENLQAALSAAQDALVKLQTGAAGVSFSYAQGTGSRSVSYTAAKIPDLNIMIGQLQRELGIGAARRPITPIFGSR